MSPVYALDYDWALPLDCTGILLLNLWARSRIPVSIQLGMIVGGGGMGRLGWSGNTDPRTKVNRLGLLLRTRWHSLSTTQRTLKCGDHWSIGIITTPHSVHMFKLWLNVGQTMDRHTGQVEIVDHRCARSVYVSACVHSGIYRSSALAQLLLPLVVHFVIMRRRRRRWSPINDRALIVAICLV